MNSSAFNLADAFEAIAATIPDAEAIVHGDRRRTWAEFDANADGFAAALVARGVERGAKVGFFAHNSVEYLEAQYGCFKIGAVPCNVNFRYTAEELHYLLDNADAEVVLFDGDLATTVEAVLDSLPELCSRIQFDGTAPHWALDYQDLIGERHPPAPKAGRTSDDLWFLYTGGTTGVPKAVMWDHGALIGVTATYFAGLRLQPPGDRDHAARNVAEIHARHKVIRMGVAAPLIHGTANFAAQATHLQGGCVVMPRSRSLDPAELWSLVERERVTNMAIVGDVFGRPLADELERAAETGAPYDLGSVRVIQSSGVMWSAPVKDRLRAWLPTVVMVDALGSSEGLDLATEVTRSDGAATTARFRLSDRAGVFTEDGRPVVPGSGERGLMASGGILPLGYYKDSEKTAATYRVIDGKRWAVAGDWATVEADGTIILLGRGSMCINTGGEKVYPEEVEETLKLHPSVVDCNVVGVSDPRWGQRVVAVAEVDDAVSDEELLTHVRSHLAGFKTPKEIVRVDHFHRNANGKSDYRWAKAVADSAAGEIDAASGG
jgi:fatty-acyl-CoA synthase